MQPDTDIHFKFRKNIWNHTHYSVHGIIFDRSAPKSEVKKTWLRKKRELIVGPIGLSNA